MWKRMGGKTGAAAGARVDEVRGRQETAGQGQQMKWKQRQRKKRELLNVGCQAAELQGLGRQPVMRVAVDMLARPRLQVVSFEISFPGYSHLPLSIYYSYGSDKYESDFINDGNDLADEDRAPIPWPHTPSPAPKQPTGSTKRAQTPKQDTVAQAHGTQAKNPPTVASKTQRSTNPTTAFSLNTAGYQGSRADTLVGVKSTSMLPGTQRGNTQCKLETVLKVPTPITVNMDSAEHEEYMLFKNSRKASSR
ncbi:hypothetical protein B0H14DRAFT_2619206 [Mycena olivaceomarginata]|nr:hypothetical protein B0H14DRAFT_2619206 [Mycena olivaceomarginata]